MKVALYVRVSTKDKQETDNQMVQLRQFAAQHSWNVTHEYIDRESGAKNERTAFRQMPACRLARSLPRMFRVGSANGS